uniref:hypothetical protein n=1 Tax=Reinekea sp. G2M2-21 TaxID=2788942 RepID=UPI0018AA1BBC
SMAQLLDRHEECTAPGINDCQQFAEIHCNGESQIIGVENDGDNFVVVVPSYLSEYQSNFTDFESARSEANTLILALEEYKNIKKGGGASVSSFEDYHGIEFDHFDGLMKALDFKITIN